MLHEYNKQSLFARSSLLGLYFQTHIESLIKEKSPVQNKGPGEIIPDKKYAMPFSKKSSRI